MTKRMHNSEPQMDRLSSLPDALLTHILSLLSTKESFCTSVLSTRWKYLFTYVPTLDFLSLKHETDEYFAKFVNMVLFVHDVSCITSFHLYSRTPCHDSDVTSWISAAILRNAQRLSVDTIVIEPCLVPRDLFTCQMLVQLDLTGDFVFGVNDSVFLPSLKTFYIAECKFSDSHSVRKLFSSCPVLEELVISWCYTSDIKIFCISVPSLKSLTIHCDYATECEWELNVPNLEYISCVGDASRWNSVSTLKSLHGAHISVEGYNGEENDKILELVNKFDEVQYLSIFLESMEFLACNSFSTPMFNKLTTLDLEMQLNNCKGWNVIGKLLKRSPCLEVLVINDGFFDHQQVVPEIDIVLPKRVPLCFSRSLKKFTLSTFRESKVEYEWLSYLLENAKVLEKVVLFLQSFAEQDEEYFAYLEGHYMIRKKILALSRGSKTCEIVVTG